jgi:adhesin HecA-like repeat protein
MLQAPDWRTGSSTWGRVSLETRMKGTVSSAGSARMAATSSVPARSGRYRLLITTVHSCALQGSGAALAESTTVICLTPWFQHALDQMRLHGRRLDQQDGEIGQGSSQAMRRSEAGE